MFTSLLGHQVTIEHRTEVMDRLNQPKLSVLQTETVRGRLSNRTGDEVLTLVQRDTVERRVRVFLEPDADVSEHDAIVSVVDAEGNTVAGRMDIEFVRRVAGRDGRTHHIEVEAREVVR